MREHPITFLIIFLVLVFGYRHEVLGNDISDISTIYTTNNLEEIVDVSSVVVKQRPGSGMVDIFYDVEAVGDFVDVSLEVIEQNAGGTKRLPIASAKGDYGSNTLIGNNRHILWNATEDWGAWKLSRNFTVSVEAKLAEPFLLVEGKLDFKVSNQNFIENQILKITNIGNRSAHISSIEVPQGISVNWDEGNIDPGKVRSIEVSYDPYSDLNISSFLKINTPSRINFDTYPVKAEFTGSLVEAKFIDHGDSGSGNNFISYGEIYFGEEHAFNLELKNLGNSSVNIQNLVLDDCLSADFSGVLQAGATAEFQVVLKACLVGNNEFYGFIEGDNEEIIADFSIQCNVLDAAVANFDLESDFGLVLQGKESVKDLNITNTGSFNLVVESLELPEGFYGSWVGSITPNTTISIPITFKPTEVSNYGGYINVISNANVETGNTYISGVGTSLTEGMAFVPAGEFLMGRDPEITPNYDTPRERVFVDSYWIGATEVTWAQWNVVRAWGEANGYDFGGAGKGKAEDHPVHSVSVWDAAKWCNALSEMYGLEPAYELRDNGLDRSEGVFRKNVDNKDLSYMRLSFDKAASGYRLPFFEEWEKAARGGTEDYRFPWGNTISFKNANYTSSPEQYSWDTNDVGGRHPEFSSGDTPCTNPVKYFAPNGYGLYGVIGNVSDIVVSKDSMSIFSFSGGDWFDLSTGLGFRLGGQVNYATKEQANRRSNSYGFRVVFVGNDSEPTPLMLLSEAQDFGYVEVGKEKTRIITLKNIGTAPLEVTSIDSPVGFEVDWSGIIAPQEQIELPLTFSPTEPVEYNGVLKVNSNSITEANQISLSGYGYRYDPLEMVTVWMPQCYEVPTFEIGKFEITWKQWNETRDWALKNGYNDLASGKGCRDNHPVRDISFDDALKWCNARSEMEGLEPVYYTIKTSHEPEKVFRNGESAYYAAGYDASEYSIKIIESANGYRLPAGPDRSTEFYVALGFSGNHLSIGPNESYGGTGQMSGSRWETLGWFKSNSEDSDCAYNRSGNGTMEVGQKLANAFGIHDLFGNVSEWVWNSSNLLSSLIPGQAVGGDFDTSYQYVYDPEDEGTLGRTVWDFPTRSTQNRTGLRVAKSFNYNQGDEPILSITGDIDDNIVNFGRVQQYKGKQTKTLIISNLGNVPMFFSATIYRDDNYSDLLVEEQVNPGDSVHVDIEFAPVWSGVIDKWLTINLRCREPIEVLLRGIGDRGD